ncbi:MAG: STAS domain-containing protein [Candidatus Krumholzibacteriia bacterium]
MGLHIERVGEVAVVVPKGMLRGGKETDELETTLRKLVYDGHKRILLDLQKTSFMSSTAIGLLAGVHTSATNRGLAFYVCNIDRRIEDILTVIKLVQVLNVFDTRDEALQALAQA